MKNVNLSSVMKKSWVMVRKYGYSRSEALKAAWRWAKLVIAMKDGIVEFMYKKVSGEMRQAWGTLKEGLIGETKGEGRKANDTLQVYWDSERGEYRSFKIVNLVA